MSSNVIQARFLLLLLADYFLFYRGEGSIYIRLWRRVMKKDHLGNSCNNLIKKMMMTIRTNKTSDDATNDKEDLE